MKKWEFTKRRGNLKIYGYHPTPETPKGAVVVSGPDGSSLEAWFGPTPAFPDEWIEWRDQGTAACMNAAGGTAGWIEDLKVSRGMRGKGLGTALLEAALEELHELGVDHVWLFAGPESERWMAPLLRFYRRHGFDQALPECGDKRVMVLQLDRVEELKSTER